MFLVSSCSYLCAMMQSTEAMYQVKSEEVVGAAPTDDAPTTSE